MPTVSINPVLIRLVKRLHKLGEDAEQLGHELKHLAVTLGKDDLGRMMVQYETTKRDSKANGGTDKPSP